MPVQSIECLLTQTQIKRYLAGADFPDELVVSLERHLKACPDCMAEANKQREELGGARSESSAVVETPPATTLLGKLKSLLPGRLENRPLVAPPGMETTTDPWSLLKTPKNLVLSGALAVVLLAMSVVSRNPSSLFGPRVVPPKESETTAKAAPETTEEHNNGTEADKADHNTHEQPVAVDPSEPARPKPKATRSTVNAGAATDHVAKAPETATTDQSASAPTVNRHEKVGGEIVVAEAGARPVRATQATRAKRQTPPQRTAPRPARRTTKAKAPTGVRVYLPDGTPKN